MARVAVLTWDAVTQDTDNNAVTASISYRIERAVGAGAYSMLASGVTPSTYRDATIVEPAANTSVTYNYRVRAEASGIVQSLWATASITLEGPDAVDLTISDDPVTVLIGRTVSVRGDVSPSGATLEATSSNPDALGVAIARLAGGGFNLRLTGLATANARVTVTATQGTATESISIAVTVTGTAPEVQLNPRSVGIRAGDTTTMMATALRFAGRVTWGVRGLSWIRIASTGDSTATVTVSPPTGTPAGTTEFTVTGTRGSQTDSVVGTVVTAAGPLGLRVPGFSVQAGTIATARAIAQNPIGAFSFRLNRGPAWLTLDTGTGVLTASPPTSTSAGDYGFSLSVMDTTGVASVGTTVRVTSAPEPPEEPDPSVTAPDFSVPQGGDATAQGVANDFSGAVTWSLTGESWISVSTAGVVRARPPASLAVGRYGYVLAARAGSEFADATGDITVTDRCAGLAVNMGSVATQSISAGTSRTVVLSSVSDNADSVAYSVTRVQGDSDLTARINGSTVIFTVASGAGDGDAATFRITVTATCGSRTVTDSEDVVVTATQANRAPVLTLDRTSVTVALTQRVTVNARATDADGDAVEITAAVTAGASRVTLTEGTETAAGGAVTRPFTVTGDSVGSAEITVVATDGIATDIERVSVTVTDPCDGLSVDLSEIADQRIAHGSSPTEVSVNLTRSGNASSPSLSLIGGGSGISAVLTGMPSNPNSVIRITVPGASSSTSRSATFTLQALVTCTNDATQTAVDRTSFTVTVPGQVVTGTRPTVRTATTAVGVREDRSTTFEVTATDPDSTATIRASDGGSNLIEVSVGATSSGTLPGSYDAVVTVTGSNAGAGSASIEVWAEDAGGRGASISVPVQVTARPANRAPEWRGPVAQAVNPSSSTVIDMSPWFSDSDGDTLTIVPDRTGDLGGGWSVGSVSGNRFTLTSPASGSISIGFTATDPGGLSGTGSISFRAGGGPL